MNKNLDFTAYEGIQFTIEWYVDAKQRSPAFDFYESLDEDDRIKLLMLFKRMGDAGRINDKTKFVNEGDKIYAFKPQPNRFLCFFCEGKKIIVTNAFRKKKQKLPQNEKERAIKYREDYLQRVKRGEYYG